MHENEKKGARQATRRRFLRYAGSAATAAAASHFGGRHAFGASPPTLRVISIPGRPLPVLLAEKQGIFAKYGVSVHVDAAPTSDALRTSLASGQADIAHAAVDNAVAMVENSRANVVIVMGGEGSINELIAQPDIHSISELRGRTLLVDAPNTAYAIQLKKILLASGLRAGSDYQLSPVGATPLRLQAMRDHKEYAASILGPPASVIARHAGFVSLGSTRTLLGPYQAIGAFTEQAWAHGHSDSLVKYLAAYIEAQRRLLEPASRASVLELFKEEWHLEEPAASATYVLMQGRVWYQLDARFDVEGFKTVLRLRAEIEGQWKGQAPAPENYCDFSYYQQALRMITPQGH
jgi:ABC-type nitrate/sulfonate/bicarbonate transport system substrate-binding protein